ncbi:MAG: hypothetical protein OEU92_15005 [Alphaproteobacteria bacterium]|nr:hypothetical protein [Alphaproteobacteria bacterium]
MPKLLRFLVHHAALGFILGIVAVGLMMVSDFAALRTLIMASDVGWLALFMLTFFLGLTLASVQMGIAIVLLGESPGNHGRPQRSRSGLVAMLGKPVPAAASRGHCPRQTL